METYVKSDAVLKEKVSGEAFEVSAKMKTDALKLKEITESSVKFGVKGVSNRLGARQVIAALLADKSVKTYSERYAELYPSGESEEV